jgi:protein involved in polysaccharide export with SLBB domain
VTIMGAVQRPGDYRWKRGMRVSDLLQEAGGPLPKEAYLKQADLERLQEDGKRRILRVDLERVLEGDEREDLLLEGRDVLRVFTYREVEFREPVVYISGAVQRPGMYKRPEGLTLSNLIQQAGGLLPGAHPVAEIARPMGKTVVILQADLEALLGRGDKAQDLVLQDYDRVSIRRPTEYIPRPASVELRGEVMLPGFYSLEGRKGSLYEVLQRAGGLTPDAFPEGAVFIRNIDLLVTDEQARIARQVADTLKQVADARFRAWLATQGGATPLLQGLPATGTSGIASSKSQSSSRPSSTSGRSGSKTRAPAPTEASEGPSPSTEATPSPAETGEETSPPTEATPSRTGSSTSRAADSNSATELTASDIAALSRAAGQIGGELEEGEEVVVPARPLMKIIPSGRIPIDLKKILESQGQEDVTLEDGDTLLVPRRPQHVVIAGAVVNQGPMPYDPKLRLKDYLEQMGGVTYDADLKHIAVVKPDGRVFQGRLRQSLELGDFVLIPTKAMLYEPGKSWQDRLQQILSNVINAATMLLVINRL